MISRKISVLLLSVLLLLFAGCAQNQSAATDPQVQLGGVSYPLDTAVLDLSGTELTEWEPLTQLTALTQLDLRDTGITAEVHDRIQAALPGCVIRWSVPFQGAYFDSAITELSVTSLSSGDLAALSCFEDLQVLNADGCTDYAQLAALAKENPKLQLNFSVPLGGASYPNTAEEITITDPDITVLEQILPCMSQLRTVTLTGRLPANDQLAALKSAYPGITFLWDFDFFGVSVNTMTQTIDISGTALSDTTELEALLGCFYQLQKVDMCGCGLSDDEMERLNLTYPDTRFIWEVLISYVKVRTDITWFMPYQLGLTDSRLTDYTPLRHCKDLVIIDMGHYTVSDPSFLAHLPNLQYLQLCDISIEDISVLGECTNLRFLEIFLNPVTDFWPLTNLSNLEDLNISYTAVTRRTAPREFGAFGDLTPLKQMTWLDRLWITGYDHLSEDIQQQLRDALPNTMLCFDFGSSTHFGWRYAPDYYLIRDEFNMPYLYQ